MGIQSSWTDFMNLLGATIVNDPPLLNKMLDDFIELRAGQISKGFDHYIQQGLIRPVDTQLLGLIVLGIIDYCSRFIRSNKFRDAHRIYEKAIDILINGIMVKSHGNSGLPHLIGNKRRNVHDFNSKSQKKYLGAIDATDEDMQIVSAVREYVDKEIMPRRQDLDGGWHRDEKLAKETFEKVHKGLVDIGVQRAIYPEEFGGLGVSGAASEMIYEEISRGDAGLATHMGIINWVMMPALRAGRMDLLEEFIPKICDNNPHGCCMAITEPSGGANSEDPTQHGRTINTIAVLDGDEWVINGHKIWPSGASVADITYCTICTTDPAKGDEGVALIYVPPDAKGMTFSKPFQKWVCAGQTRIRKFFSTM